MPKNLIPAFAAGFLASGMFLLIALAGLGFFFMFLPTLPIFYVGLGRNHRTALIASIVASITIGLLAGMGVGILFLLCFGIPTWYLGRQSLWWRHNTNDAITEGMHEWYPIGYIILHLTIGACLLVAAVTLFFMSQGDSIVAILSQEIHDAFSDLQEDYGDVINMLASQWSFLIFSMTIWIWGLALYAHAWLANRFLIKKHENIRPDFTIVIFSMPNWMLGLLVICGIASLIGSESIAFLGNAVFIALLLPYFLLGCALMHQMVSSWPNRRFFLFFIYFIIFAQFWPVLILSGMGLWHHIKHLNNRLSSGGTSFKS